jgi:hypothetical protein
MPKSRPWVSRCALSFWRCWTAACRVATDVCVCHSTCYVQEGVVDVVAVAAALEVEVDSEVEAAVVEVRAPGTAAGRQAARPTAARVCFDSWSLTLRGAATRDRPVLRTRWRRGGAASPSDSACGTSGSATRSGARAASCCGWVSGVVSSAAVSTVLCVGVCD